MAPFPLAPPPDAAALQFLPVVGRTEQARLPPVENIYRRAAEREHARLPRYWNENTTAAASRTLEILRGLMLLASWPTGIGGTTNAEPAHAHRWPDRIDLPGRSRRGGATAGCRPRACALVQRVASAMDQRALLLGRRLPGGRLAVE